MPADVPCIVGQECDSHNRLKVADAENVQMEPRTPRPGLCMRGVRRPLLGYWRTPLTVLHVSSVLT